ncbi:MAG: hypothetical protein ACKVGZ_15220, partial [Alphaproteobacteria bacterium]
LIQTFKISTIHHNRESRSRPRRKGVGNYIAPSIFNSRCQFNTEFALPSNKLSTTINYTRF